MNLSGIQIHVAHILCDPPSFLRWKKNHRKSRINKKWHKRYGPVLSECLGAPGYQIGGKLYVCPHLMEKIKADPMVIDMSSVVGNKARAVALGI